ncbi:MAG: hypothetical protein K2X48_07395 [Chitinophagaceae bacterium]|nr:hypothetical protein [Chitinophagaceae bacterium]
MNAMNGHENKPGENPDDEPLENLNTENEILKLKMQAEYGAVFGKMSDELTPEMEHEFLKNVLRFEEEWKNKKMTTVYELIEKPSFKPAAELNEEELKAEVKRLKEIMESHKVVLTVRGRYKAEVIYKFITEELFNKETEDMRAAGMTQHFTYEEFHPNHKLDIHGQTMDFLKNWFEQSFNENTAVLAGQLFLITDPKQPPVLISKEEVVQRMQMIFDSYQKFDDCQLAIMDIGFQWDDANERGVGHSEGGVKYDAVLENGTVEKIQGPFKLYFSCEFGLWQVMHFVFPQFKWPNV